MTHKFEIKETIEVSFPHFRRVAHFFYKVINENCEVSVDYYPSEDESLNSAAIKYDRICKPNTFRHGSYEITEDEFNTTFNLAFELIKNKHK